MFSRQSCPACDSLETERVELAVETDSIVEVRACNDCYAGYNVEYADPTVEITHEPTNTTSKED